MKTQDRKEVVNAVICRNFVDDILLPIADEERPFAELFGDGSVVASKCTSLFNILGNDAPLIASIDQGQTLWKIYEAIMEIESWWDR